MALTLNDEQEAALRQWWSRYGDGTGYGQRTLHEAVAPMMKPWQIVSRPGGDYIVGPDDTDIQVLGIRYKKIQKRVCDLLNESEARR